MQVLTTVSALPGAPVSRRSYGRLWYSSSDGWKQTSLTGTYITRCNEHAARANLVHGDVEVALCWRRQYSQQESARDTLTPCLPFPQSGNLAINCPPTSSIPQSIPSNLETQAFCDDDCEAIPGVSRTYDVVWRKQATPRYPAFQPIAAQHNVYHVSRQQRIGSFREIENKPHPTLFKTAHVMRHDSQHWRSQLAALHDVPLSNDK
jgi:hypothetical protein